MKENFIIQDGTVTWRTKRIYIDPDTGIQLSDIPIATPIKTGLMPAQSYTDLERLKERKLVDLPSNMVDANEKFLNAEGSWVSILDENTTYLSFNGATGSEAGTSGLVPAPEAGDSNRFLSADGNWKIVETTDTTYDVFDSINSGLVPASSLPSDTKFLSSSGKWLEVEQTDTTYNVFNGATGSEAGTSGLVPAPAAGDNDKFLTAAGSWASIQAHQGAIVDQETYDILYNLVHQTETEYSVGERVYTKELPTNLVLECVTAGTTGSNFTIE